MEKHFRTTEEKEQVWFVWQKIPVKGKVIDTILINNTPSFIIRVDPSHYGHVGINDYVQIPIYETYNLFDGGLRSEIYNQDIEQ